ncbi:hypothetical protein CI102_10980 [Trichoderma harzianum]|uniref:Uncharacterized protein n=1 Tax=Trichoderma harzianum CBS 226.95 TaxID=983964 RepID=A0A2T4A8N2_TRIHA|nr:hypothetical protein M431DRAFT_462476 [Trichoderma harzianum CBS 226.95]PKK44142.1 hypothetical protein CI102_10980 [Trichoderma harzianum]PTB53435.1 hypothetical protein M431DRAFT_462476 [Trichoderma harzianum CBS 226.95]
MTPWRHRKAPFLSLHVALDIYAYYEVVRGVQCRVPSRIISSEKRRCVISRNVKPRSRLRVTPLLLASPLVDWRLVMQVHFPGFLHRGSRISAPARDWTPGRKLRLAWSRLYYTETGVRLDGEDC